MSSTGKARGMVFTYSVRGWIEKHFEDPEDREDAYRITELFFTSQDIYRIMLVAMVGGTVTLGLAFFHHSIIALVSGAMTAGSLWFLLGLKGDARALITELRSSDPEHWEPIVSVVKFMFSLGPIREGPYP